MNEVELKDDTTVGPENISADFPSGAEKQSNKISTNAREDSKTLVSPDEARLHNNLLIDTHLNQWSSLTTSILFTNLLSAISLCMLSFPFALTMVFTINEAANQEILTYSGSILTNLIGFATVLIYSQGRILFRTFTGILFPILASAVETYGKEGLATATFYVVVLLFLGAPLRLFKMVYYVPNFLFETVKIGTGSILMFEDIYTSLHIKSKSSGANIIDMISDFHNNRQNLMVGELIISLAIGVVTFLLQKKYRRFPWTLVTFVVGISIGYYLMKIDPSGANRVKLLRDVAPKDFEGNSFPLFELDFSLLKAAISGLRHPELFFYGFGVLFLVFFEVSIAISLDEDTFDLKVSKTAEFVAIAGSNAACLVMGVLPQSIPVCRQKLILSTGANHKVMHLFCILIMLFLYYFCFSLTGYIPICFMKALNFMLSLNLMDFTSVPAYGKYSKFYQYGMIGLLLVLLFLNLAWCILIGLLVYLIFTFVKQEKARADIIYEENGHMKVQFQGRYAFTLMPGVVKEAKVMKVSSVTLDFSKCIKTEINFLRNYRRYLADLEKTVTQIRMVGIEGPGVEGISSRNQVLNKVPCFKKYLIQAI